MVGGTRAMQVMEQRLMTLVPHVGSGLVSTVLPSPGCFATAWVQAPRAHHAVRPSVGVCADRDVAQCFSEHPEKLLLGVERCPFR